MTGNEVTPLPDGLRATGGVGVAAGGPFFDRTVPVVELLPR